MRRGGFRPISKISFLIRRERRDDPRPGEKSDADDKGAAAGKDKSFAGHV
jgi:hypothetical protein